MGIRIHSLETYFDKYVLPLVFIPWNGLRGIKAAFPSSGWASMSLIIALWALFTAIVFWNALKIKRVTLDHEALLIKGYLKEVSIPFSDLTNIKTHLFLRPHWTIHLKTPTVFGTKIAFIPKRRIATANGSKSTFAELQARIAGAQA